MHLPKQIFCSNSGNDECPWVVWIRTIGRIQCPEVQEGWPFIDNWWYVRAEVYLSSIERPKDYLNFRLDGVQMRVWCNTTFWRTSVDKTLSGWLNLSIVSLIKAGVSPISPLFVGVIWNRDVFRLFLFSITAEIPHGQEDSEIFSVLMGLGSRDGVWYPQAMLSTAAFSDQNTWFFTDPLQVAEKLYLLDQHVRL